MAQATQVVQNFYRDSVSLMRLSSTLANLPGIQQACAVMASEANLRLARDAGLLAGKITAGPNDLLIALEGKNASVLEVAMTAANEALHEEQRSTGSERTHEAQVPRSLAMAVASYTGANLALISTPGDYAAAEAMKALRLGLNVMLFSDNISLEDELALKRLARAKGLLVMGPDCGTAIIDGVPLAFANVVRRGPIGCVGASGTGLQQVTCLVDRLGLGISQAIGTGGHDLHQSIGGISMLQGIEALGADHQTEVLVLISKPPSPDVADKVLSAAAGIGKPVVVNFIGADAGAIRGRNLFPVKTLEDAARAAVALAQGRKPSSRARATVPMALPRLAAEQRYVRGLYSGGTFCYEASMLLGEQLDRVWSNAPVHSKDLLPDGWKSRGHAVIDLGDDVFTRGRPHPMIDHRLRNERILAEALDREVAVILLDIVLGYGAHADPAAQIVPVIVQARAGAAKRKRRIVFVGFVCGTPSDPQGLARQEDELRKAGMLLAASNAEAVRLAARIASRGQLLKRRPRIAGTLR